MKFGVKGGQTSPWDMNFESEFQTADENFTSLIPWLAGLEFARMPNVPRPKRFLPQPCTAEQFDRLTESVISLAVRSPMTREMAARFAEFFRGPLSEWERNALIASTLRGMQGRAAQSVRGRGKAVVIRSPDREFIFGDGFYHTLKLSAPTPRPDRILVPLTPRLAVLYACPLDYIIEPRVSTLTIDSAEAETMNETIQIYSKKEIFYRTERPSLSPNFLACEHLKFRSSINVVEDFVHDIPGIPPRKPTLSVMD
jgi:hypothetical protein